MSVLVCPVCKNELFRIDNTLKCSLNHSFDFAKEGYVNLLSAHKTGDRVGDNKSMAASRKNFLNKGYYKLLSKAVAECLEKYTDKNDVVLDICCGEGYYTSELAESFERRYYGFDISKNMVRLAAKRKCGADFFVANISSIPIKDSSVKFAFHLFAPFHSEEFSRILCEDGVIITAVPGRDHLFEMKQILYKEPYYNDEKASCSGNLIPFDKIRAKGKITLETQEDIQALFQMTPYYYHTPSEGMNRLESVNSLTTTIDFVLYVYKNQQTASSIL